MQRISSNYAIQTNHIKASELNTHPYFIYINSDLVNSFLKDTQVQTETTKRTYKTGIKRFVRFIGKENSQPRYDDVLNFIDHLEQQHKAPSTIQTYTVAVRLFFKWAENSRLYPNIARDVKGVRLN